jgi:hypothetical protein
VVVIDFVAQRCVLVAQRRVGPIDLVAQRRVGVIDLVPQCRVDDLDPVAQRFVVGAQLAHVGPGFGNNLAQSLVAGALLAQLGLHFLDVLAQGFVVRVQLAYGALHAHVFRRQDRLGVDVVQTPVMYACGKIEQGVPASAFALENKKGAESCDSAPRYRRARRVSYAFAAAYAFATSAITSSATFFGTGS